MVAGGCVFSDFERDDEAPEDAEDGDGTDEDRWRGCFMYHLRNE
jgi:hypothetical protein